jgi:toxin ParE1/3/4
VSRAFIVRRAAQRDIDEAREWYDLRQAGVGQEFVDDAEATLSRVRDNPELYPANRRGVRQALINRFPYIVYYLITDAAVVVFAVIHTRRHPRSWRTRL